MRDKPSRCVFFIPVPPRSAWDFAPIDPDPSRYVPYRFAAFGGKCGGKDYPHWPRGADPMLVIAPVLCRSSVRQPAKSKRYAYGGRSGRVADLLCVGGTGGRRQAPTVSFRGGCG